MDGLCKFEYTALTKPHRNNWKILTGDLYPPCRSYPNFIPLGPSTEELWALEAGWLTTRLSSGCLYYQQCIGTSYRSVSTFLRIYSTSKKFKYFSSTVVFSLISQSFSQDFMKFLCGTFELHWDWYIFCYNVRQLEMYTSCSLFQLFRCN